MKPEGDGSDRYVYPEQTPDVLKALASAINKHVPAGMQYHFASEADWTPGAQGLCSGDYKSYVLSKSVLLPTGWTTAFYPVFGAALKTFNEADSPFTAERPTSESLFDHSQKRHNIIPILYIKGSDIRPEWFRREIGKTGSFTASRFQPTRTYSTIKSPINTGFSRRRIPFVPVRVQVGGGVEFYLVHERFQPPGFSTYIDAWCVHPAYLADPARAEEYAELARDMASTVVDSLNEYLIKELQAGTSWARADINNGFALLPAGRCITLLETLNHIA